MGDGALPGFGGLRAWTKDHTERYLTKNPLPGDFWWKGRQVIPHYQLKKGYGFWLRTTPYHRGLFDAVHRHLATCEVWPTGEEIAAAMREFEKKEEANRRSLFDESEGTM